MLNVEGLSYTIAGRQIFTEIDLQVPAGSSAVLLGRSGSGKSTLLACVLGLVRADAGVVFLGESAITDLPGRALAEVRRSRLGMVFQDGELLPELTAVENVALAALLADVPGGQAYDRAGALLKEFGVPLSTQAGSLSGGERQRTAVARALINEPQLILADEPTGALDEANRDSIADLLFELPGRTGCALLVATHDADVASRADACVRLVSGGLEPVR